MSTIKRLRRARREGPTLKLGYWELLNDLPPPEGTNQFAVIDWNRVSQPLWIIYGARITERFAQRTPGTRPSRWWLYTAPRIQGPLLAKFREEGFGEWVESYTLWRDRVGGQGTPARCPASRLGLPVAWWADDFDPADPPIFESQAAFLKRHGLLLPGERPPRSAFTPEALPADLWPITTKGNER